MRSSSREMTVSVTPSRALMKALTADPLVDSVIGAVIVADQGTAKAVDHPEFAAFLVGEKIDSISLNPDSFVRTLGHVAKAEATFAGA